MLAKYMQLEQFGKVQVEYIWIGGTGLDIRAKTRTLKAKVNSVEDIPCWNYDGSSTGQAEGHYSEIWLKPVRICRDPFRGGDNILCLGECLNAKTMEPSATNRRNAANKVFEQKEVVEEQTWFGIEQEYTLFDSTGTTPLGWPNNGFPAPQVSSSVQMKLVDLCVPCAGSVLLLCGLQRGARPSHRRGALPRVPLRRTGHLWHQRRSHGRAVGVPGGTVHGMSASHLQKSKNQKITDPRAVCLLFRASTAATRCGCRGTSWTASPRTSARSCRTRLSQSRATGTAPAWYVSDMRVTSDWWHFVALLCSAH